MESPLVSMLADLGKTLILTAHFPEKANETGNKSRHSILKIVTVGELFINQTARFFRCGADRSVLTDQGF